MNRNCIDLIDGYKLTGTPVVTATRLIYIPSDGDLVTSSQGRTPLSAPVFALASASA